MTDTTPDYAGLIAALYAIAEGYPAKGIDDRYISVENPKFQEDDGSDPNLVLDVFAIRTLLERSAALERERDEAQREAKKQKERLFKQIYFTSELQRLLWALAEGNPLPDTIKEGYAYTVASRAKARAEAAEAKLAEAMKALAEVRRRARNIWGACSSDQIIDKDVERQAKLMLEYIDAYLEKGNSDGE